VPRLIPHIEGVRGVSEKSEEKIGPKKAPNQHPRLNLAGLTRTIFLNVYRFRTGNDFSKKRYMKMSSQTWHDFN
jgi:hypothetical protein